MLDDKDWRSMQHPGVPPPPSLQSALQMDPNQQLQMQQHQQAQQAQQAAQAHAYMQHHQQQQQADCAPLRATVVIDEELEELFPRPNIRVLALDVPIGPSIRIAPWRGAQTTGLLFDESGCVGIRSSACAWLPLTLRLLLRLRLRWAGRYSTRRRRRGWRA